jgi:hypothetical protein
MPASEVKEPPPVATTDGVSAEAATTQPVPVAPPAAPSTPAAVAVAPHPSRWRAAAAAVLLVLGVILVPLTAVSWWVRGTITDTDKWVAAVAPLASDPQVQAAVTDQVTDRVMARVQSLNLSQQATDALIARGVPPQIAAAVSLIASPIQDRTESLVHRVVGDVVASEAFANVWTGANRVAHQQLIQLLNGDPGALTQADNGQLVLNLSAIAGPLRTALVNAGVPFADKIPDINTQVVVGDGTRITQAKDVYRLVKGIPVLLLILTILLLAAGIFFSHRRLRATLFTLAGIVVAILITLAAVKVGREYAVENLRQDVRGAAQAMIEIVTDRLRTILRVVGWVSLVALVVALVSGNGPRSTALRRSVRNSSEAAWSRAMAWEHTFVVAVAVTVVSVVVLFVTDLPTFWNLLFVLLAVGGGIVAWFRSRPDDAADDPGSPGDELGSSSSGAGISSGGSAPPGAPEVPAAPAS